MHEGRIFLSSVIQKYKDLPILWKRTHPDYTNRTRRNKALGQLVELFRTRNPAVNKEAVQRKINSIRGCFRKELNKVRQSEKTASSPDEVHVPKLWYYNLMLFLKDQEQPFRLKREYSSSDEKIFADIEIVDDESMTSISVDLSRESTPGPSEVSFKRERSPSESSFENTSLSQDESFKQRTRTPCEVSFVKRARLHSEENFKKRSKSPSEVIIKRSMSPSEVIFENTSSPSEVNFEMNRPKVVQTLDNISNEIEESLPIPAVQMQPKQPHDAFGQYIAEALRLLPPEQLPICHKLINDTIFFAEIGALKLTSRIVP